MTDPTPGTPVIVVWRDPHPDFGDYLFGTVYSAHHATNHAERTSYDHRGTALAYAWTAEHAYRRGARHLRRITRPTITREVPDA